MPCVASQKKIDLRFLRLRIRKNRKCIFACDSTYANLRKHKNRKNRKSIFARDSICAILRIRKNRKNRKNRRVARGRPTHPIFSQNRMNRIACENAVAILAIARCVGVPLATVRFLRFLRFLRIRMRKCFCDSCDSCDACDSCEL